MVVYCRDAGAGCEELCRWEGELVLWALFAGGVYTAVRETLGSGGTFADVNMDRCHPTYLSTEAHAALTRKGAFEGLKIHTDAVGDVLTGFAEGSLDCAVVRLVSLCSPSSSTSFAAPTPRCSLG